jgi:hypothetical protein
VPPSIPWKRLYHQSLGSNTWCTMSADNGGTPLVN